MAKRLTDSDKWNHPTFRLLPLKAKLTWVFLLDDCDHAGFWLADYDLASFRLGFNLTEKDLAEWFGDKLFPVGSNRIFIPDYVRFQQKVKTTDDLQPNSNVHKGILREFFQYEVSLEAPGIPLSRGSLSVVQGLPNPSPTHAEGLPNPPGIGIGSIKGTGSRKGGVGENQPKLDFDALYEKYPRKEGKSPGLLQCRKQIKTKEDYAALETAIERYANDCSVKATEPKFIKQFSTFMGCWRDWLDPKTGTASLAPAKSAAQRWAEESGAS